MPRSYNKNIIRLLSLSHKMMSLADKGDLSREDATCGKLFGILRESAYRIQIMAEDEKRLHQKSGIWDIEEVEPDQPDVSAEL